MSAALWVGGWPIGDDGGVLVSGLGPPPVIPELPLVPTIGELFDTGALLTAVVTSNGAVTTVTFEYGTTTAYGTTIAADQSPLSGAAIAELVSALVGGLTADTTYHWRVSATNSAGTTVSSDQSFTTLPAGTLFFDPLFNSLVPTTAGNPTPTFTRATTAYATAIPAGGNSAADQTLILCAAGEARFHGARRISSGNWSKVYSNNKLIPLDSMLGLVTEYAGTNVCLWSQDYTNAAWNKDGVALAANSQVAPDGTTTASTLTESIGSARHNIRAATTTTYCFSVYLKAGTTTWVQVGSTDGVYANFNLVTGATGFKHASITPAIVAVGNGWWRCSIANTPSFTGAMMSLLPSDLNTFFPTYVGTGVTVHVWGMQAESANSLGPSSYIPTTSVNVTRNEDVLDYATATNFPATTGTVYAETALINTPKSGILPGIVRWDQLNFLLLYTDTNKLRITTNNGSFVVNTANSFALTTQNRNASAYSGTTASICLDGGTVGTGSFVNGLPASASFRLGGGSTTQFNLNGTIRNVRIYNARITDAKLIPLTAIAPTVTTVAASGVTATGATLNGTVTSNGLPTTVDFQYGKTTNYNKTVTATQSPLAAGAVASAVSVALTGLQTGTLYHYRVVGTNSSGATYGSDMTFTPAAVAAVTWNPADKGSGVVLSNGNLTAKSTDSFYNVRATTSHTTTGKFYFEVVMDIVDGPYPVVGIATASMAYDSQMAYGGGPPPYANIRPTNFTFNNSSGKSAGITYASGDRCNVALDLGANKIWFGKNGVWILSGNPATGANATWTITAATAFFPIVSPSGLNAQVTAHFAAASWVDPAPSGFVEW